jgi:pimeloyl-ACP methyl ester carboxylesterase
VSTFVLIPGAGGAASYWSQLVPLLEGAGHAAVAVDLPGDDESAGLPEYTRIVLDAIGDHDDVILVASSLGGFTAPLVAERAKLSSLVLVNAMIPLPGEVLGAWWGDVGAEEAREAAARRDGRSVEFDVIEYFLHDLPPELRDADQRGEAGVSFGQSCDFTAWPDIPIKVIAGADDRFFPVEFQQRVARERLGLDPVVLPGGHLIALSQPGPLAAQLTTL